MERCPGVGVDFCFQCCLQRGVRIVLAEEVGVADEETFFVVVGVDEPAGDLIRGVADDFAGLRFENIYAVDVICE
jgi:hypothetical protein